MFERAFHRSIPASRQSGRRGAFTLAELLIVIAIIAVLIGILLPALSAARRSSAAVKCLASLRQIGSAFQQYAQENRRFFPVIRWAPTGTNVLQGPNTTERVWIDFVARYLNKTETNGDPAMYEKFKNSSVFWGCPAYNQDLFVNVVNDPKSYSLGYGMSRFPIGPYRTGAAAADTSKPPLVNVGPPVSANYAEVTPGATPAVPGAFFKMEQWGRRSQDKALIADSNGYWIQTNASAWTKANESANPATVKTQPLNMGMDFPATGVTGTYIGVDATRHIAPTANAGKVLKSRGVNMLFVDGHAAPVSPREAWIAMNGAGVDLTQ